MLNKKSPEGGNFEKRYGFVHQKHILKEEMCTENLFYREQAADYIRNPADSDSRHGLKRSLHGTPVEDGDKGTSSSKTKPSFKDKGMVTYNYIVNLWG